MHGPDHVLPADGTLAHPLAALGAGDHVTALQQDAVDGRVHADLTEVLLLARRRPAAATCRRTGQRQTRNHAAVPPDPQNHTHLQRSQS